MPNFPSINTNDKDCTSAERQLYQNVCGYFIQVTHKEGENN